MVNQIKQTKATNDCEHEWHFVEAIAGKTLYKTMAVGMSVMEYPYKTLPNIHKFVCVKCGEVKKVEEQPNETLAIQLFKQGILKKEEL